MFNLPGLTLWAILGIPALWIIYTLAFLWFTRHWERHEQQGETGQ